MTTPAPGSGRPSAIHHSPAFLPGLLCAALLACALPAVAADPQDPLTVGPQLSILIDPPQSLDASPHQLSFASTSGVLHLLSDLPVLDTAGASGKPKSEGRVRGLLNKALALLGTPYRWGGSTPEAGFDCSGLIGYVYRTELGVELPRISRDMAQVGELIRDRTDLQEGDLVFFSRRGRNVDHVGLYIGEGRFVHSPRTGKNVEIATLDSGYWAQKFMKGRRVAQI